MCKASYKETEDLLKCLLDVDLLGTQCYSQVINNFFSNIFFRKIILITCHGYLSLFEMVIICVHLLYYAISVPLLKNQHGGFSSSLCSLPSDGH